MNTKKGFLISFLIVIALLFAVLPGGKVEAESTVPVYILEPSWSVPGGGGVFSAYIPSAGGYYSPGLTALYDGREAGIIKAGLEGVGLWDQGLYGFIPNVTIDFLAARTLSYDMNTQAGVNSVWMTIEIDTGVVDDRVDNVTYQHVPANSAGWHTINAAAGLWQKWNNNEGDTSGNPYISLADISAAHTGKQVVRAYLRLGKGDSYYNGGTGTIAWVDKVTMAEVTYDFLVNHTWYVATTGDDSNTGTTADDAFLTIQHAIDAAGSGDTIHVAAGTYDESATILVNESVSILGPTDGDAVIQGINSSTVTVLEVSASDVNIENFGITHSALPAFVSTGWVELPNSLVRIPINLGLSGVSIKNNEIYVPAQAGAMSLWNGVAITVGANTINGISITGNTIHNTRNGIVVQYGNTATISDNVIYDTKGGIMNYTSSQADADNRTVFGNLWGTTHNEWDIVWNSAYYVPNYQLSVLDLSNKNNEAYVLDRRAADAAACAALTGNRSHIFVDDNSLITAAHPARGNFNEPFATLQLGLDAVVAGGKVFVAEGTYTEIGQIVIEKNVTIIGANADTTIIKPDTNYTDWWMVNPGVNLNLNNVTLDGEGKLVRAAIRTKGSGTIDNIAIRNIYNTVYEGWGIAIEWSQPNQVWSITNSEFMNIQRVGVLVDGQDNEATLSGNTFEGKGVGDWVNYGIEIGDGANAIISGNSFEDFLGEASTDGSDSAGILVTSHFGPNPTATVTNNTFTNNTMGIAIGYDDGDSSAVTATGNTFTDNHEHINALEATNIDIASALVNNTFDGAVTIAGEYTIYGSIQAAVDASDNGDVLNIIAGTYDEDVDVNKSVSLIGAGATQTIVTQPGTAPVFTASVNNVSIKNMAITDPVQVTEGIRVSGATSGLLVENVAIGRLGAGTGANAYGIRFMNSFEDLTVTNTEFIGMEPGVYTRAMGIFMPVMGNATDFSVTGSTFMYVFTGVDIRSSMNLVTLSGNTFGPMDSKDCTAAASGIYFGDGPTPGFTIDNVTISGNDFVSYCRGVYVWDYADDGFIKKMDITGNTFTNSIYSSGIRIMADWTTDVTHATALTGPVTISANEFTQSAPIPGSSAGVAMVDIRVTDVDSPNAVSITDNDITFSGTFIESTFGVIVRGPITDLDITGNVIDGGGAGGTSAGIPPTSGIVIASDYDYFGKIRLGALIDISGNTIMNLTNGISVYDFVNDTYGGLADGVDFAVNLNNITTNTIGLAYGDGETIDATGNWWGNVAGPAEGQITGNVSFCGWLIEPYVEGEVPDAVAKPVINTTTGEGFCTIQVAIDDATAGDTITVAAGTYIEDPVIDKALTLLGPNATINPNTGTRVGEAIIVPAVSAPDPAVCEVMTYIEVSGVTIKGFTFDGDNPALTSNVLIGTADVDACKIIASYEGVGNIVIENNILKHATYTAIEMYNYTNAAATSGNYIQNNLIQDIGETTYSWGIGILLYNNFYADVTGNVMEGVRLGIQTGNYYLDNPGTTGSISNNEINAWALGIFHNLWYSAASNMPVSGNTINAVSYPGYSTKWNGMLVTSFAGAANTSITNNIITIPDTLTYTQYSAGYNVWNDNTTLPLVISGGTVTGGTYGVFVNNYDGYPSDPNIVGSTSVTVDGVTILKSDIAGVYVKDNSLNTHSTATVYANIINNNIDTDGTGILIEGSDATASVLHNDLVDNPTAGITNLNAGFSLDATENWWGSVLGPQSPINGSVDVIKWCGNPNPGCDPLLPDDTNTITLDGTKELGDANIYVPGLTIVVENGLTIANDGACFNINASYTTIQAESKLGAVCKPASGFNGIDVADDLNNVIILNLAFDGTGGGVDGIHFSGGISDIMIVDNWFHGFTGDAIEFTAQPTLPDEVLGTPFLIIQGNLFETNGGLGINASTFTVPAEFNSWGHVDGAIAGDGKSEGVDADPWTHVDLYVGASGVVSVGGDVIVTIYGNLENVMGANFTLHYDPAELDLDPASLADLSAFVPGLSGMFIIDETAGTITFDGTVETGESTPGLPISDEALPLFSATFEVLTSGASLNFVEATDEFYMLPTTEGYNPSTNIYALKLVGGVLTDTCYDVTGTITMQGRTTVRYGIPATLTGITLYGPYTATTNNNLSNNLAFVCVAPGTYTFTTNQPRYLNVAGGTYGVVKTIEVTDDMILPSLTLIAGNARWDNNRIDAGDSARVGACYGYTATCPVDPSFDGDVNFDGKINLLDLSIVGGNFYKTSASEYGSW